MSDSPENKDIDPTKAAEQPPVVSPVTESVNPFADLNTPTLREPAEDLTKPREPAEATKAASASGEKGTVDYLSRFATQRRWAVILWGLVIAGGGAAAITYFLFPAAITAIATLFALTGPLALILPLVAVGLIGALFGMELMALLERALTGNEARNRVFMRNLIIATTLLAGVGLGLFLAATTPIILNFAIGLVGPGIGAYALVGAAGLLASVVLAGILVGGARAVTAIRTSIAARVAASKSAAIANPTPAQLARQQQQAWVAEVKQLSSGVPGAEAPNALLSKLAEGVRNNYKKDVLADCVKMARERDPRTAANQDKGDEKSPVVVASTAIDKIYDSLAGLIQTDLQDMTIQNMALACIKQLNPAIELTTTITSSVTASQPASDEATSLAGPAKPVAADSLLAASGKVETKQTEVKVASAAESKEAAAFEPLATTPTALDRRDSKAAASATEAAAAAAAAGQQQEQQPQPEPGKDKDKDTSGQSGPSTPA